MAETKRTKMTTKGFPGFSRSPLFLSPFSGEVEEEEGLVEEEEGEESEVEGSEIGSIGSQQDQWR